MSSCKCDETPAGPEPTGKAFAQVLPMVAGAKAGEASVSAALLAQDRKQRAWLERRGRLDGDAKPGIEAREQLDRARLRVATEQLFAAASIPETDAEAMTVGGRVTKEGAGQEGLVVSALGRNGKAMGCAATDARGMYRITLPEGGEALLQVTTAGGRKQLYLDDRPIPLEAGGLAVRHIALSGATERTCPDGPDTSNRAVMPDLVGKPVDEAVAELRRRKIALAGRRTLVRTGFEDRVVATDPEAGRLLEDPAKAVLVIGARGEEPPPAQPERGEEAEAAPDRSAGIAAAKDGKPAAKAAKAARARPSPRKG